MGCWALPGTVVAVCSSFQPVPTHCLPPFVLLMFSTSWEQVLEGEACMPLMLYSAKPGILHSCDLQLDKGMNGFGAPPAPGSAGDSDNSGKRGVHSPN